MFSMLINDCMWLAFWVFYFDRFPVVKGWERQDIICLWAILELGYGLAYALFGNSLNLAGMVARGELDVYLTQPKNVLLHSMVSRSMASAWGDVISGIGVFVLFGSPTPARWLLFVTSGLLAGVFLLSFTVIAQSLVFYIGNSETLAFQMHNAMIHFSSYPTGIFEGWVRVLIFTILPAGFISYLPIGVMRHFSWSYLASVAGVAVGFTVLAVALFNTGLRRYESGNLMTTRL
jgi:ABC-2 type transport system permease protein